MKALAPIRQAGVTLVELLVAVLLISLITVATVALYSVNSQSSKTVDTSSLLDDNARFAFELIGQAVRNTGFRQYVSIYDDSRPSGFYLFDGCVSATEPCPMLGFDNSKVTSSGTNFGSANSGGHQSSDSLVVRFAGSGPFGKPDGSMIDCLGAAASEPKGSESSPLDFSTARGNDLALSAFWVQASSSGEPELMCTTSARAARPVVRGVEAMQIMYAEDSNNDNIPNRWVSASAVTNWQRIRAVRVGLILRGEPGSAQVTQATTWYPLGQNFDTAGSYTNTADNRLRRQYISTFFIRNEP